MSKYHWWAVWSQARKISLLLLFLLLPWYHCPPCSLDYSHTVLFPVPPIQQAQSCLRASAVSSAWNTLPQLFAWPSPSHQSGLRPNVISLEAFSYHLNVPPLSFTQYIFVLFSSPVDLFITLSFTRIKNTLLEIPCLSCLPVFQCLRQHLAHRKLSTKVWINEVGIT